MTAKHREVDAVRELARVREEQALDRRAAATQEDILLEIALEHLARGARVLLLPSGILLDARRSK